MDNLGGGLQDIPDTGERIHGFGVGIGVSLNIGHEITFGGRKRDR